MWLNRFTILHVKVPALASLCFLLTYLSCDLWLWVFQNALNRFLEQVTLPRQILYPSRLLRHLINGETLFLLIAHLLRRYWLLINRVLLSIFLYPIFLTHESQIRHLSLLLLLCLLINPVEVHLRDLRRAQLLAASLLPFLRRSWILPLWTRLRVFKLRIRQLALQLIPGLSILLDTLEVAELGGLQLREIQRSDRLRRSNFNFGSELEFEISRWVRSRFCLD